MSQAAAFFNMRIIHIPVDEVTRKVNIKKMQRSISRRTCMVLEHLQNVPIYYRLWSVNESAGNILYGVFVQPASPVLIMLMCVGAMLRNFTG